MKGALVLFIGKLKWEISVLRDAICVQDCANEN